MKWLNLDLDNTLGGEDASDYKVSSQKAIKEYVDNATSSALVDDKTIAYTTDKKLEALGVLDKNTGEAKYDWIGTEAEWIAGRNNNTIPDDWICYIVDDETESTPKWGSISGTLSNQSDLQDALDNKQNKLSAGTGIEINSSTNTISTLAFVITDYTEDNTI